MKGYPTTSTRERWGLGATRADLTLVGGEERLLAELKVHAQAFLAFGTGKIVGGVDDRGNAKLKMVDASGNTIHGNYIFAYSNHSGRDVKVLCDKRSEDLEAGTVKLGEAARKAKEDSFLRIYFTPDASATINFAHANNDASIPITTYE